MDPDKTLYLVYSNPAEGRDDEFNSWYDEVHVPDVLAAPGLVAAQRFDLQQPEITRTKGAPAPTHRYLTVYEIDGDVDAAMAHIRKSVASGDMAMSDSLDLGSTAMSFWSPQGPKVAADSVE